LDRLLVDNSLEMLSQARASQPDLEVIHADFSRMPLDDASMAGVICSLALAHSDALEDVIAEFARVLRPDGRIVICDIHPSAVSLGWQAFFRHPSGEVVFVRNRLYSMSEYFSAFSRAGLQVARLSEIAFDRESLYAMQEKDPLIATVWADAFDGLPALVVWVLERSARG
jgi:ubiquinone/menaquinone biosynthesis C-methylase UbiE